MLARGCELRLFLPLKVGNMDCTLCLDCVHACPHDNIALAGRVPGAELADSGRRSGIGRFAQRRDIAALAVVFTFGSLLNAFGMTGAGRDAEAWFSSALGGVSEAPALAALFAAVLLVVAVRAAWGRVGRHQGRWLPIGSAPWRRSPSTSRTRSCRSASGCGWPITGSIS